MGMSSRIVGVRDLDGQFQKMINVKLACQEAGIPYPQQVRDYFKYPEESEDCLRREMEEVKIAEAVSQTCKDAQDIFEVDLTKLSPEIKAVRFINSY